MAKNINHGKFYQDKKNGPWRIDTRIKIDGKYYHIQKRGFATKHEAQAAYDSVIEQAIKTRSQNNMGSGIIFENFLTEFEKHRGGKCCKATTATNDFYLTKKYLIPTFGGLPISEAFSPKRFLPWYDDLASNTHVSVPRRNKAIRLAKGMLQFAYSRKMIGADAYQDCDVVCTTLKEPNKREEEKVLWNAAQCTAFLSVIDMSSPDFIMFSLMLETAPRIGEFLALTADCVDFENCAIKIQQQIVYQANGEWELIDRLKSHESYRKISIMPSLLNALKRYITALNLGPKDFLFGPWGSHTTPLSRTEFRRKLTLYTKAAKLPAITPHTFRHMLETSLIQQCASPADVQAVAKMMGHSMAVSMKIYQHNDTAWRMQDIITRRASSMAA